MSVRRRVRAIEERVRVHDHVRVPIILDGRDYDHWRARVEEARRHGWRLNVIRFSVMHVAETLEEAEALVAQHQDQGSSWPITVYRDASPPEEILAEWAPELPEWLRDGDDE